MHQQRSDDIVQFRVKRLDATFQVCERFGIAIPLKTEPYIL
jgi:hypothetical protein